MNRRKIPGGTIVFREGEVVEELFVCLSGAMSASVGLSNGARRELFAIKQGDFFGETALIAREPQFITVTAMEDVEIAVLATRDFQRILAEHPLVAVKILKPISLLQNEWFDRSARYMDDLIRWGTIARRRTIQDELTGLYNQRFLEDALKDRFQHWEIGLRKMSLVMMDLDKIHAINERYGSLAGDKVIIAVAETIRSVMRSTDICARFSGDEFAILLPDAAGEDAARTADRLRETISLREVPVPDQKGPDPVVILYPRTSIGVAEAPTNANSVEALMLAADQALRKAKDQGRNKVVLAN
jgi:diguanylate cyclase (GGDEF)-like protein